MFIFHFWLCARCSHIVYSSIHSKSAARGGTRSRAADYFFKKMKTSSFLITVMICNTGFLANCESVESAEEKELRDDYLDKLHTLQEIVKGINVTENNVKERFRVTVGSTGKGANCDF